MKRYVASCGDEPRRLYRLPKGGLSESDLDLNLVAAAPGPITTKGMVEQVVAKYLA